MSVELKALSLDTVFFTYKYNKIGIEHTKEVLNMSLIGNLTS